MVAAERGTQIPLNPPFSKGEFSSVGVKPLFGKEGKGEIFEERCGNYIASF
jgi:hypothetical protein